MQEIVQEELAAADCGVKTAAGARGTGDFLSKIIHLIRGCGFGIAIFSDATPPKTLANIFFEVGYCLALGKPTHLILAGENAAPSDFVRTEWIQFDPTNEDALRKSLRSAFSDLEKYGRYLEDLALAAEDAEEPDPELAFERFKRAFLVTKSEPALDGVERVFKKVRAARGDPEVANLLRSYRRKISDEIAHFKRRCGR